ncbi:MAG: serine hydrolase [Caldilineaceae bacterium]|nr:serine hydrolase [Caldilineaceae bacterium]
MRHAHARRGLQRGAGRRSWSTPTAWAPRRGHRRARQPDSVFRITSMTKSFTALAVLRQRDERMVRLDGQQQRTCPSWPTWAINGDAASVNQLLAMAGWPGRSWADRQLHRTDADLSALYREGIAFSNHHGRDLRVLNMAYIVLGRIITNVARCRRWTTSPDKILRR